MQQLIQQVFQTEQIPLSAEQLKQFELYYELLVDWNTKINLTAITEPTEVAYKHFLDSALFLRAFPDVAGKALIDVGTGAGFPGIPVRILEHSCRVTLFDSLNKRINFLRTVCDTIGIADVATVHGRAEESAQKPEYRAQFDLATARAVARMPVLAEYCLPFVKVGGHFVALKGPELDNELAECKRAFSELGGKLVEVKQYTFGPENYTRNIAIVEKVKETPKKYPRKAGTPNKNPL